MLSMTLTGNLRLLASQLVKPNSFAITSRRNLISKKVESKSLKPFENDDDSEEIAAREAEIENKRNKSNLYPEDFNRQHGKPPYDEPLTEYHESLKYRRLLYGKYGESSKVNPSILWPSKKELEAMREYEGIAQPFTVQQLIQKVQEAKKMEAKEREEAEAAVLKKVSNIDSELAAYRERCAEREKKVQEVIAHRNRLIEQVRSHFGYKIDVHDERFKAMLAELEKEEKKQAKIAKKARQKARREAFLAAQSPQEDSKENVVDEEEK